MTISAAMSTSLSAMQAHTQRLSTVAQTVATANGAEAVLDPAGAMLELLTIEHEFAASASVFETGAEMWEMLATVVRD